MKCRDLSMVEYAKGFKLEHRKPRPLASIDTETYKGRAFVIAVTTAEGSTVTRLQSWADVLRALTPIGGCDTFAWNAGFDARALLMHLPLPNREELYASGRTLAGGVQVRYIEDKLLRLAKGKRAVNLWDASQFYEHLPLKEAAGLVKGEKITEDEVANLSPSRYDSDEEYRTRIDRYVVRDAELCFTLAALQVESTGDHRPGRWHSQASIAEQYAYDMHGVLAKPPRPVQQAGLLAYSGGRFEVFKRGMVRGVYTYDIHSAYPWAMSTIPDTGKGVWHKSPTDDPLGLVRLLRIDVRTPEGCRVGPVAVDRPGSVYYPCGELERWVVGEEYDAMRHLGYDVRVLEAWIYNDPHPTYPWKYLKTLYKVKEGLSKEDPRRQTVKIILNGTYGKTIQLTPVAVEDSLDNEGPCLSVSMGVDRKLRKLKVDHYQAGGMFEPVTAALVTGKVRAKLLRSMVAAGPRLVAVATDSITVTGKERVKGVRISAELGDYSLEAENRDMVVIGSGLYWYVGDKAMKARGVGKKYPVENLESPTSRVTLKARRVIRRAAALRGHVVMTPRGAVTLTPEDENRFIDVAKSINLNADDKRVWQGSFSSTNDQLSRSIESLPHVVAHRQRGK